MSKRYTVKQAVDQARAVATANNLGPICVDAVKNLPENTPIDIQQYSNLVEEIIADTKMWR